MDAFNHDNKHFGRSVCDEVCGFHLHVFHAVSDQIKACGASVKSLVLFLSPRSCENKMKGQNPGLTALRCCFLLSLPGFMRMSTAFASSHLRLYSCIHRQILSWRKSWRIWIFFCFVILTGKKVNNEFKIFLVEWLLWQQQKHLYVWNELCLESTHTRNRNAAPGSCHSVRWFTDYILAPCWNNQTKKSCFSVI